MKHGKYGDLVRIAGELCKEVMDYYDEDDATWEDDKGCELYPHNVLERIPALQAALLKATAEKTRKGKKDG